MKNGTLRFIPLQADLCLNKQKVDIEDFKGWQKCNAPVYGGCLSPLYKKVDTHHDIFIGNDTYDFEGGKLYKNGVEVLSGYGSKKLKKTKLAKSYSSLAVSSDKTLVTCEEISGNALRITIGEDNARDITINYCQRILKTKCFAKSEDDNYVYGCVALYLHTNGKYGYWVGWKNNNEWHASYGASSPTLFENWTVNSPLIQVATISTTQIIISLFGTCGADIASTQVKNIGIFNNEIYDNLIFSDSSLYPDRYESVQHNIKPSVVIENRQWAGYWSTGSVKYAEYALYQHIQFNWEGDRDIDYIGFESNANVNQSLALNSTEKARKSAAIKITYWRSAYDNILHHRIERLGVSDYEVVHEGTGVYQNLGQIGKIIPIFKTADAGDTSNIKLKYTYKTTTYPNDPTEEGTLITSTFETPERWNTVSKVSSFYTLRESLRKLATSEYPSWLFGLSVSRVTQPKNTAFSGEIWYDPYRAISDLPEILRVNNLANKNGSGYYNWDTSSVYNFNIYTKQQIASQALKECDCVLDDGRLYCVGALYGSTSTPLPFKLFSLAGEFNSFDGATNTVDYHSIATFNISYQTAATEEDDTNVYPKYWGGMSINLQDKYLRIIYKFKAKLSDEDFIYFMVDNSNVASASDNIILYPGVLDGTDRNIQGSCVNYGDTEGWRLLFNNNMISNIACYEKKEYIGTILADWLSVDSDFSISFAEDILYYKDNSNTIWKIEMVNSGEEWAYRFVENRFIVLNTTNYFNCYDTQTGQKRHWASDYNNRVVYGFKFSYYEVGLLFLSLLQLGKASFNGFKASAQNANYEITKDPITSLELGAARYSKCFDIFYTFYSCQTPYGAIENIDVYSGERDSTSAIYVFSIQNGLKIIDTQMTNPPVVYPISANGDVRYNPNLFSQFITSYNNKDMIISDGIAYRLLYFNNVIPVMAYYLLDGVESLENAFVLQTSYYGVAKTRLYQMNYSNGVGVEVVCDITNLEYLGALPSQALFWSAQNRAIYSFQGNCIMHLTQYANELTGIYGKWYNPATQELFLDTNIGILVFSDLGTYCLEWDNETNAKSVRDIFFFEDYFIINFIADVAKSHYYSYNNKTGYESNKVYFITKYYGNGLVPITVNNIYIRLYDQAVENVEGFIKMKGYTITDKGTETDTKEVLIGGEDNPEATPPTVAGEAWDSETGTMLVKYTPQFNRGLGFALEVETTFPIIDIKFDYVENGSIESQIAHVNI